VKYDIVLLNPPSRSINHYRPSLNLAYLGGFLRAADKKVMVFDYPMKENIRTKSFFRTAEAQIILIRNKMLQDIKKIDTDYIGISCCSTEFDEVKELIFLIRKSNGTHTIIVGGVHPTLYPEDFHGIADIIVRGEGEFPLNEIIERSLKKATLTGVISKVDYISYPDYSFFDMDYYTTANPYAIRGVFIRPVYISCGRGCPSQCTFCVAPALRGYTGFGRMRTPRKVVAELVILKEQYSPDGFYIIDDLFTQTEEYVISFCNNLYVSKLNMLWGCNAKISTITYPMLVVMAKNGCVQIDFGIERGSDEELMRIKKYQTIATTKKVFKWCKELGIRTFANFLVGIEGESLKHLKHIRRLTEELKPTVVSYNVYTAYPGTQLKEGGNRKQLVRWAELCNKKYNRISEAVRFHSSRKYLSKVLRSPQLLQYLVKSGELAKEAVNQLG
jgi:anaerobic magnesium-protoporphyrin IX monomethyl ester cyclase